MADPNFGAPTPISATGAVKNIGGALLGFLCTSSSSGTLALYDNPTAASGNNIIPTMNLVAGTYYPFPAKFGSGLWAVIGGTAGVTFILA